MLLPVPPAPAVRVLPIKLVFAALFLIVKIPPVRTNIAPPKPEPPPPDDVLIVPPPKPGA